MIRQAVHGDRVALAALLEQEYDRVFRAAYTWCGNKADAEDVAQESCIKISRSISSFNGEAAFSSWVYRLVLNTAKDSLRKRKPTVDITAVPEPASGEKHGEEALAITQLWQAVRQLPEKQRDAVLLVYREGCTQAEAAYILDCPEGTVAWYISEAKQGLKGTLNG